MGESDKSKTETMKPSILLSIPARLNSSRLPGKILADVNGKPLLRRVIEQCMKAERPSKLALCIDSDKTKQAAESWELPSSVSVIMTPETCTSGSERIAHALPDLVDPRDSQDLSNLWILNIQGDQPFIDPKLIDNLATACTITNAKVVTPVYPLSAEKVHNPAVVKCLLTHDNYCLAFSRSAIPHVRDIHPDNWHQHSQYWGHVGIYCYRGDFLANWQKLPISNLEKLEKLEQLRILEAGFKIQAVKVSGDSFSVDTQEQLEEARVMAAQFDND